MIVKTDCDRLLHKYWYLLDHGAPPTAAPPPSAHHDGDAGVEEHPLPVPQVRGAVHQRSENNDIQFQHNINSTSNCQSFFYIDTLHVIVEC